MSFIVNRKHCSGNTIAGYEKLVVRIERESKFNTTLLRFISNRRTAHTYYKAMFQTKNKCHICIYAKYADNTN